MFNNTFYPTPETIANKMLEGIDFTFIQTVLEPCAGKGDLIAAVQKANDRSKYSYNYSSIDIDAVELDPNLRALLKGNEIRVVHDNFLTMHTSKHYDLIIMNPPFNEGDKHLFRLMEKNPDVTVGEVQYIVSQIFAGKNATKDYAATTSRNSADEKSLINRVKVLEQYLAQARKHFAENAEHDAMMQEPQTEQEPQAEPESAQEAEQIFDSSEAPEPSVDVPETESSASDLPDEIVLVDDPEGYEKFCAEHEGKSLVHSSGEPQIKFSDFTEEDKYDLFLASKTNDTEQMDRIIARRNAVMELTA